MYYAAIALTVASNVFYHIFQKVTPPAANPLLALTVTYAVSTLFCMGLFLVISHDRPLMESIGRLNWTSIGLGFAIVGLELGFLLAYRSGWNISIAVLVSTVAVAMILLPIGLMLFHEHLSPANAAGFVLCTIGLILINGR
ncbi:MAG TPA: hypothetical protein VMU10_11155 [Desulfomonilia bacterium]|nr:hypothetical protein [Desulfomonilia bacterium]